MFLEIVHGQNGFPVQPNNYCWNYFDFDFMSFELLLPCTIVQGYNYWNLKTNRDISEYFRARRLPLRKKNKYNVIKPDLYSLNIYFGFKCLCSY